MSRPPTVEEFLKTCTRIIDQEELELITGFGHIESLPTPPNWNAYARPNASDECRNFLYVEIAGVGEQDILITPETEVVPLAKNDPGNCAHTHLTYGVFRQHFSFSITRGIFLEWAYIGGGALSGVLEGTNCILTTNVNRLGDYGKFLQMVGLLFGADQFAIEGSLITSIFSRTVVAIQAQTHFGGAGCRSFQCFPQVKLTVSPAPSAQYSVKVATGNVDNAGTDANATITLFGAGMSAAKSLNCRGNRCERRDRDIFNFSSVELQDLTYVSLSHDNSGDKAGWYVSDITVNNLSTGKEWFFPVHRWLASDECNGELVLLLIPELPPPAAGQGCRRE